MDFFKVSKKKNLKNHILIVILVGGYCYATLYQKAHGLLLNQEISLDDCVGSQCETHCSQFVKASKKLIKKFDQLLSAA